MVSQIKTFASEHRFAILYIGIALIVAISYPLVISRVTDLTPTFKAVINNVTVNLLLVYGYWGYWVDHHYKGNVNSWVVFFAGMGILTLIFRLLGMETILG